MVVAVVVGGVLIQNSPWGDMAGNDAFGLLMPLNVESAKRWEELQPGIGQVIMYPPSN